MRALILMAFVMIGIASAAPHVIIVDPVVHTISEGETLDLGVVGPGQRLEVEIRSGTGEPDFQGEEKDWDRLLVDESSLPIGWEQLDSKYYERIMKAFVIVSPLAPDGEYAFALRTFDEYQGTDPVRFNAKVKVSRDVFRFQVLQEDVTAGTDQPAVYAMKLQNLGSASDAFRIEVAEGLPSKWAYTRDVFVPHNTEQTIQFELVGTDQGEYNVHFTATSLSSAEIQGDQYAGLIVRSSIIEEMKAAGRGMLLFPTIEQIVYNLIGLIAINAFE
ncbi:hypothetical protein KJ765_06540 [Candidatus Micrarchaeota archaeon]|nr:hypothetical protein [Candidatus Micrarchaeota archaeon]